ncbi:MAG: ral nucleoside transport system ATP-binding protein [Acidobacteriota bacterium]|jgi:simple sugar transport system ATP-binding protein|nr:ral nucleoside transport system ATP-binding protein [Acidobacteriota bacterium]
MLRLSQITKRFGANRAVDEASLVVAPGEIVALVGENGAGKTTLMRIAAGELAADGGTVEGAAELVHQHFMLVAELTIAENLALARREPFRLTTRKRLEAQARAEIEGSGIDLPEAGRRVGELSVGEKSKVELIKAIAKQPATLILDEPTSVLTPYETEELFRVMRRLAANGTAVVFISHKLPEVLSVADRIVVMRRGRVVAERRTLDTTAEQLAAEMVGAMRVGETPTLPPTRGTYALQMTGVSGDTLREVTLDVPHHAIVALLGVAGNGQGELAGMLRGLQKPSAGTIAFNPARVAHIPEDRTRDGIVAELTIAENIALPKPRWRPRQAAREAEELIRLYSIRAEGPGQRAGSLSGGNQQKVVLARELQRKPELIVAAEPTRGLDIDATRFVHDQLRAAATGGAGILLITSDLDEAFALATDVHVIYRGRLSPRMTPDEARLRVANLMAGVA